MNHYKVVYINYKGQKMEIEVLAPTPQRAMRDFIASWGLLGVSQIVSFAGENL